MNFSNTNNFYESLFYNQIKNICHVRIRNQLNKIWVYQNSNFFSFLIFEIQEKIEKNKNQSLSA